VPTDASQLVLSMMTVAPSRQTFNPATYRWQQRQRIRQVSGWEAISGLKGGLSLLQQHHFDGVGIVRSHQAGDVNTAWCVSANGGFTIPDDPMVSCLTAAIH